MRFLAAALLLALLGIPTPASAGLETPKPVCDEACTQALRRFADTYMAEHAPMLAALPERFEAAALASGKNCPARRQSGAAVYGVMLGPGDIKGLTKLEGPANDIALMGQVMADRGIMPSFVFTVEGIKADRAAMLATMAKPLPCLREGDQVVLVYSGWGTVFPQEWLDFNGYFASFCTAASDDAARGICATVNAARALGYSVSGIRVAATAAGGCIAGLGGASLTLFYPGSWNEGISSGQGLIAVVTTPPTWPMQLLAR